MLRIEPTNTLDPARDKVQTLLAGGAWLSAVTAAIYPWILDGFHWAITQSNIGEGHAPTSVASVLLAALLLVAAFSVPAVNLIIASRPQSSTSLAVTHIRTRRFAIFAFASPTIYVFFGVLTYMAGSKVPDVWIWVPTWLLLGFLVSRTPSVVTVNRTLPSAPLRILHGVSGAIVSIFILFHVFNHLFGLVSPEVHGAIMEMGRIVYRSTLIEPVLIAALLFQIATGLRLAWTWSEISVDRFRVFQVASGVFLSVFILGHMNSVFFYARTFLDIPTDWAFAAGLPSGVIFDPWNIRLVPHYALGVFLVLAHLCSGLRVVMLAHKVKASIADRLWWVGTVLSALISMAIISGMAGLRLL